MEEESEGEAENEKKHRDLFKAVGKGGMQNSDSDDSYNSDNSDDSDDDSDIQEPYYANQLNNQNAFNFGVA